MDNITLSILVITIIGIGILISIILFGRFIYYKPIKFNDNEKEKILNILDCLNKSPYNFARELANVLSEFVHSRNDFWMTYGQLLIAIFIIIAITILLLTKTISAEAGLPILSGISGFAIAKSISSNKPNKKENSQ